MVIMYENDICGILHNVKSISTFLKTNLQFNHLSTINIRNISRIGNSPSKEFQIPVPWGHIAAKRWGKLNGKPVLAIHGWQDNAGSFDPLAPLLPNHWDLVCIDLPGHGLSSHYQQGHIYFVREYLGAVVRTLKFLKWNKFDYIGHSLGAALGFMYISLFPDNINYFVSLELIKGISEPCSSSLLQSSVRLCCQERLRYEKEGKRPPPAYNIEKAIEKWHEGAQRSPTTDSIKILFKRGAKVSPDGKVSYTRDRRILLPVASMSLISTEQYFNLITHMKCHFLIIKGKQGGFYESSEIYKKVMEVYKKNCKSFKYIEIDGTHHLHLNSPESVSEYIVNFIK